jgi:DNA repair protein RadC
MSLDARHRILATENLFAGTVLSGYHPVMGFTAVHLRYNAAPVILFHNRPLGGPEPGAADPAWTARLKQALALLDILMLINGGRRLPPREHGSMGLGVAHLPLHTEPP